MDRQCPLCSKKSLVKDQLGFILVMQWWSETNILKKTLAEGIKPDPSRKGVRSTNVDTLWKEMSLAEEFSSQENK